MLRQKGLAAEPRCHPCRRARKAELETARNAERAAAAARRAEAHAQAREQAISDALAAGKLPPRRYREPSQPARRRAQKAQHPCPCCGAEQEILYGATPWCSMCHVRAWLDAFTQYRPVPIGPVPIQRLPERGAVRSPNGSMPPVHATWHLLDGASRVAPLLPPSVDPPDDHMGVHVHAPRL